MIFQMGGARGSQQKNPGAGCWHVKGMSRDGVGVDASRAGVERVEGTGGGVDMSRTASRYADEEMRRQAGQLYLAMRMGRYALRRRQSVGCSNCVQTMDMGARPVRPTLDASRRTKIVRFSRTASWRGGWCSWTSEEARSL